MNLSTNDEYTIIKIADGGFVVMQRGYCGEFGNFRLAATKIDTALDYVREKLTAKPSAQRGSP